MKPNSHIAPFLAQPVILKVGLNHLGYRNAAEDLVTTLLPVINNVTAKNRYYCWLLEKFLNNTSHPTVEKYKRAGEVAKRTTLSRTTVATIK